MSGDEGLTARVAAARQLLLLKPSSPLLDTLWTYPLINRFGLRPLLRWFLVPAAQRPSIQQLEESLSTAAA